MPDKYFVDTNILMYAHDRSAGLKHERARQLVEHLWTSGQGVLSTQVLQELCINLRRKIARPLPTEEVRRLLQDYLSWEIVVNTPASVLQALEIEVRYKTSGMLLFCKPPKAQAPRLSIPRIWRRNKNTVRFR